MNQYGSITPIRKICQDGRRRGEAHEKQQVDRSVLEKMHSHRWNTSEYICQHNLVRIQQIGSFKRRITDF